MARRVGSKDSKPRKRRMDEDLMRSGQETGEQEPEQQESLRAFMAGILNDEEYRNSFRARAKSERLTPAETMLLVEFGLMEAQKPKRSEDMTQRTLKCLTTDETRQVAEACRIMIRAEARANGRQEPGDQVRRYVTRNLVGEEIATWR